MSLDTILKSETTLEEQLINVRRSLHQEPELSSEEFNTTKKIKEWLKESGIRILDLPLKTGVVAEISGQQQGPTIAIRADIDALPIHEETDLPFKSQNPGIMHACGHDFHTAVILGAAYLLKQMESRLKGTVKIIFQPAEESGHGAETIIKTGALDDVEAIFGLHNNPLTKLGAFGTKAGITSASVDRFEINITGKGAHAARPYEGIDPIIIASEIVSSLQNIVSRQIKYNDDVVISVTHIRAGSTWNVIPGTAYLEGTVRTFNEEVRQSIPDKMERIIKGVAYSYGAEASLTWHAGPPSVNNDAEWTEFVKTLAEEHGYHVFETEPSAGGEDFACYQQIIRGAFVNIGVSGKYGLHHPQFTLDESAILPSTKYFADLAEKAIEHLTNHSTKHI